MSAALEVDLVDIGVGNTGSVKRCLDRLNINYRSVNRSLLPKGDRPIILPGVGAFGELMDRLDQNNLTEVVRSLVSTGTPYLGICVGMQILFDGSEESPTHKGFGLISGKVVKFRQGKVPQIGWNQIVSPNYSCNGSSGESESKGETKGNGSSSGSGSASESGYVYFVNSYYPQPADKTVTSYEADYFGKFCAAVKTGNITAMQFHPEKSGEFGARLLKRWVDELSK